MSLEVSLALVNLQKPPSQAKCEPLYVGYRQMPSSMDSTPRSSHTRGTSIQLWSLRERQPEILISLRMPQDVKTTTDLEINKWRRESNTEVANPPFVAAPEDAKTSLYVHGGSLIKNG